MPFLYDTACSSYINKDQNDYKSQPEPGVDTIWKAFQTSLRQGPNKDFIGSRDPSTEGRPYKWKTWRMVSDYVDRLAHGYVALNLMPETVGEGQTWKFMGIYAKNREEWTLTDMAAMRQSGTTIAFYDTLGAAAVEFVIK